MPAANELLTSGALTIRRAKLADADRLTSLAAKTFAQTYGDSAARDDLRHFVNETFSVPLQKHEIAERNARVLLAEFQGSLAGYAYLTMAPGQMSIKLDRFYLDATWHGSGLSQLLMQAALKEAGRRGARRMTLGVWGENGRAVAFYKKEGFRVTGTQEFRLGKMRYTDLRMERDVGRTQ